jgi:hypothetical protein
MKIKTLMHAIAVMAVLLAAVVLASAQTTQPINNTVPSVSSTQSNNLDCAPGADLLRFSDWNSSTIREACLETTGKVRQRVIASVPSVNQIVPVGRQSFYTYSNGGKLNLISLDFTGNVSDWQSWRIPGGGFMAPVQNQGAVQMGLVLPWEYERHSFWLFSAGNYYSEPTTNIGPVWGPSVSLFPSGNLIYLDCRSKQVWSVKNRIFGGLDYVHATPAIPADEAQAYPVGLVSQGDTAYVLMGNQYVYPDLPATQEPGFAVPAQVIPGKILAVKMDGDRNPVLEEVLKGLDVDPDVSMQRLVVSNNALYVVVGAQRGRDRGTQIVKYDLAAKKATVFLAVDDSEFSSLPFLSGLSVAPNN